MKSMLGKLCDSTVQWNRRRRKPVRKVVLGVGGHVGGIDGISGDNVCQTVPMKDRIRASMMALVAIDGTLTLQCL